MLLNKETHWLPVIPGPLKGVFTPIRGMTSGFRLGSFGCGLESEEEEHYPGIGHGARYGPTMFTKQVSRPVDSPIPRRGRGGAAGRANSKKDLVTGPIRGFRALHRSGVEPEEAPPA